MEQESSLNWELGSAPSPAPVLRNDAPREPDGVTQVERPAARQTPRMSASASRARIARSAHSRCALLLPLLRAPAPVALCAFAFRAMFPRLSSDVSERPPVYVCLRGAFENENVRWRCCCCGVVSSTSGRDRCCTGGARPTAADAARGSPRAAGIAAGGPTRTASSARRRTRASRPAAQSPE